MLRRFLVIHDKQEKNFHFLSINLKASRSALKSTCVSVEFTFLQYLQYDPLRETGWVLPTTGDL